MPIKFQCMCGKVLTARDGSEGRRTRCPACRKAIIIPAPLQLPEGEDLEPTPVTEAADARKCPNCGQAMAPTAVLCVRCGFDLRTGAAASPGLEERPRRGVKLVIPYRKIAIGVGVVGALAAAWFLVLAPTLGKVHMTRGVGYVTNGDLDEAVAYFKKIRPDVAPAEQDRIDLWLKQIQLESEKNSGRILDQGLEVRHDDITIDLKQRGFAGGALMIRAKITNTGKEPLVLSNDHFYVRGISDIVLVATHTDNSLDGVVVAPGETKEGNIAFRKVPNHPVQKGKSTGAFDSMANSYYYFMLNDGTNYVKRMLPF